MYFVTQFETMYLWVICRGVNAFSKIIFDLDQIQIEIGVEDWQLPRGGEKK